MPLRRGFSSIAVRRRKVEVSWRLCRQLFQCLCFAGSCSYSWRVMIRKTGGEWVLFADIVSLERNLIEFLLITLVLGLTQEKVIFFWISPWSCRSQASKWCLFFCFFHGLGLQPYCVFSGWCCWPTCGCSVWCGPFREECRQDPEFRKRVLGLERMLRVKAALLGAETVPVCKVSGAVPGVSCAHPVRCFRGDRHLEMPEVNESE